MSFSVLSIVGARPQFVKAAMVSRAFERAGAMETLVHTGQHYDDNMSKIFFDEMGIRKPDHDLEIGSGGHAYQTAEGMIRLEPICIKLNPDVIVIYGDTNATLAGALVGAKLNIPVAHIEAGLRSFDRTMPEEINRIVADNISSYLFCPTEVSVDNLAKEGITDGVYNVGDVMYDATLHFGDIAGAKSSVLADLGLKENAYVLVTIHRDFNTDDCQRLSGIVEGLISSGEEIVLPAHPRLRKQMRLFDLESQLKTCDRAKLIDPIGYLDMLRLEKSAKTIMTDSGGIQKEAFFNGVPCLTVRPSTEWVETVEMGWNRLVEPVADEIVRALESSGRPEKGNIQPYGDGNASGRIVEIICGKS